MGRVLHAVFAALAIAFVLDPWPLFWNQMRQCEPERQAKRQFIEEQLHLMSNPAYGFRDLTEFFARARDAVNQGCLWSSLQHVGEHSRLFRGASDLLMNNMLRQLGVPKTIYEKIVTAVLIVALMYGLYVLATNYIMSSNITAIKMRKLSVKEDKQRLESQRLEHIKRTMGSTVAEMCKSQTAGSMFDPNRWIDV